MIRNRRGLTLLELLLVLVLLAVIGSLAAPAIFGSFSSVRLRRAADQVLASWSQARTRAIEKSETQGFYFERATGNFQLGEALASLGAREPLGASPMIGSPATIGRGQASAEDLAQTGEVGGDEIEYMRKRELPDALQFYDGQFAADLTGSQLSGNADSLAAPILFFPDGTATDASLVIVNEREQFVRLTLRGLTGVGRTSDVLTRDELARYQLAR